MTYAWVMVSGFVCVLRGGHTLSSCWGDSLPGGLSLSMSPFFFFGEPLSSFSPCNGTFDIFIGLIKFFIQVDAWGDTWTTDVVFTDCIAEVKVLSEVLLLPNIFMQQLNPTSKKPSCLWKTIFHLFHVCYFTLYWGGTTLMKSSCDHILSMRYSPFSSQDIVSQNCNLIHLMTTPPQNSSPKQNRVSASSPRETEFCLNLKGEDENNSSLK